MSSSHPYRIVANIEWTSKCNARCAMCPRSMISSPQLMSEEVWQSTLQRLNTRDLFRCVIAGYGEPTTHPRFDQFVDGLRHHPVRFDMATNGSRLNADRLERLDGALDTVMISFSSVDPTVYQSVHTNLDQQAVMEGILLASRLLKTTRLVINLSPTVECLDTLEETVGWLRGNGVSNLHMSPTYYDRAGSQTDEGQPDTGRLRSMIRRFGLGSQETAFIPGVRDIVHQWRGNRFKCIPRNTNLLISAQGDYTWCFNDIRHSHTLGNVVDTPLRAALRQREEMESIGQICNACNLRDRYRPLELARVGYQYAVSRLLPA